LIRKNYDAGQGTVPDWWTSMTVTIPRIYRDYSFQKLWGVLAGSADGNSERPYEVFPPKKYTEINVYKPLSVCTNEIEELWNCSVLYNSFSTMATTFSVGLNKAKLHSIDPLG
jgi:hypothetical protein